MKMKNTTYFTPFKDLTFEENICFLTGEETQNKITVFPEWLMKKYLLEDETFQMMGNVTALLYKDLTLPCSEKAALAFQKLDKEIEKAFNKGYEGMKSLSEERLFQWIGRMVYGVLYHEITIEKKRCLKYNKEFGISPFLRERYGMFHLMLQSLIKPIDFGERKPWSIVLFQLKYSADIFNYRDDAVHLLFTMGINGFGFIAHLQDNGLLKDYYHDLLNKIDHQVLHPIQYEELYARFHYSTYILQYSPKYKLKEKEDGLYIQSLPIEENENRPLFGRWDDDMFAQLLANYWAVYGFEKKDILKFQMPPKSYLENPYTKDFILPESITLPF